MKTSGTHALARSLLLALALSMGAACSTTRLQDLIPDVIQDTHTTTIVTNATPPFPVNGVVTIAAYNGRQHAHVVAPDGSIYGIACNDGITVLAWRYANGTVTTTTLDYKTHVPLVQSVLCPSLAVDAQGNISAVCWVFAMDVPAGCKPWRLYVPAGHGWSDAQWIDESALVGPELWEPWQTYGDGTTVWLQSFGCRFWRLTGSTRGPAEVWNYGNGGEKTWADQYAGLRYAATGGCRREGGNKLRVSGMPAPVIWQMYTNHIGQGDDMAAHVAIVGQSGGRACVAQYNRGVYVNVWTGSGLVYGASDAKLVSVAGNSGTDRMPPALCRRGDGWMLAYVESGRIVRNLIGADGAIGSAAAICSGSRPAFNPDGRYMVYQSGGSLCLRKGE